MRRRAAEQCRMGLRGAKETPASGTARKLAYLSLV